MGRDAKRRLRQKGRRSEHTFIAVPHYILDSPEFGRLSGWGIKLIFELARQYKGSNNGDLSAAFSVLRERGWNSSATLSRALTELLEAGWIIRTRQGGRNRCSLYALTWWEVNDCPGKWLEVEPERVPSHKWKTDSVVPMCTNVVHMCSSGDRERAA